MNRRFPEVESRGRPMGMLRGIGAAMLASAACMLPAVAAAEGVYVSGQDMAMAKAFTQALVENPAPSKKPFWVVVAGADVKRLTRSGANSDSRAWTKQVLERGGMVYVCRTDMMRQGLKEDDLLDGVTSMYGYSVEEWAGLLPAKKEGIVLPENIKQSQLILRTCAGSDKPVS